MKILRRRPYSLLLLALVACGHEVPRKQATPPTAGSLKELWSQLEAIEMVPQKGSLMAMLSVADLPRKAWDLSDQACRRPREHGPLDAHALSTIEIEFEAGPRQILFQAPRPGKSTVILVHGLFDSKYAGYIETTAALLLEHGYGIVAPDMRWHGCRFADAPPSLGPKEADDLATIARWLQARHPASDIGLIGFSLGAMSVSHALARDDAEDLFVAGGVVFSPPGNLEYTVDWLDRRLSDLYSFAFRGWLKKRMSAAQISCRRGAEFRSAVDWLALQAGYTSTREFLSDVDLRTILPRISRPLQVYTSDDDPYFTAASGAYLTLAATDSCYVNVQSTPYGGHIAHAVVDANWFAASLLTFFASSSQLDCGNAKLWAKTHFSPDRKMQGKLHAHSQALASLTVRHSNDPPRPRVSCSVQPTVPSLLSAERKGTRR